MLKSILQMKKEHTDAQFTIRRLQRENAAMHREVEICSVMFRSADKYHKGMLESNFFLELFLELFLALWPSDLVCSRPFEEREIDIDVV